MTVEQVKDDLSDIRCYYAMQDIFKEASQLIIPEIFVGKVQIYNSVMSTASPKLFAVYVLLYMKNFSQQRVADEWAHSREYVRLLNKKLYEFLAKKLTETEKIKIGGKA